MTDLPNLPADQSALPPLPAAPPVQAPPGMAQTEWDRIRVGLNYVEADTVKSWNFMSARKFLWYLVLLSVMSTASAIYAIYGYKAKAPEIQTVEVTREVMVPSKCPAAVAPSHKLSAPKKAGHKPPA